MCVHFKQLSAFRQIARITGVNDQTGSEEVIYVLKDGRITNDVLELSVDLES